MSKSMTLGAAVCAALLVLVCGCGPDQPKPPPAPAPPTAAASPQETIAMAASKIPEVGTRAPNFTLASSRGGQIGLSDYRGQIVVLYFYPKAFTPGCTTEACAFRDALAAYDKAHIAVLGISPDPLDAVVKFGSAYHLNFPLLADSDHAVSAAYGVWKQKSMYGKSSMGVARTTFVIGKDGRILHVFTNVKPTGHDQEVLAWLKANGSVPS